MKLGLKVLMGSVFAAALSATSVAHAGLIPYPNPGTVNPAIYNFTAAANGPLTAYFAGSSAAFEQEVGVLVNGVQLGGFGLDNKTSAIGQTFTFGNVTAGDKITFIDHVISTGNTFYSLASPIANPDGIQHAYSTLAAAGQISPLVPAGTYVGFEDILGGGDLDYNDTQFVFTNIAPGPTPGAGLAGLALLALYGAARLRRA
jgi:hypothetical protein